MTASCGRAPVVRSCSGRSRPGSRCLDSLRTISTMVGHASPPRPPPSTSGAAETARKAWISSRDTCRSGGRASAPDHPVYGDHDHATDHGDHDALDVDAGHVGDVEDRAGQVAPDDGTHDAQDDGEDDAFPAAHDQVRDEPGDRTQHDPGDDAHGYLLAMKRRRMEYARHQKFEIRLRPGVLTAAALDASRPAPLVGATGRDGNGVKPVGLTRAISAGLRA